MASPRVIVADLFCGEFGWQLMKWQGYLRHLATNIAPVKVYCESQYRYLYEDFAEIMPVIGCVHARDKWYGRATLDTQRALMPDFEPSKALCENPDLPQAFKRYGRKRYRNSIAYDILIHARSITRKGDGKQNHRMPKEFWGELLADYFGDESIQIGWIGSNQADAYFYDEWSNVVDLRCIPLQLLCDIMASSKVIIGPSSGPMHLASLCGLPHLVWTDKRKYNVGGIKTTNWNRYKKHWNPLKTPAYVIDTEGWQPSPEKVKKALDKNRLLI